MTAKSQTMGALEWTLLFVLSVLWGGSFFLYKILVAEMPPITIALGRAALAAVALNLWLVLRGDPLPRSASLWRDFAIIGVLNNVVPFVLIAWGETRIASGLASILNAATPVFTVLIAHWMTTNEKLSWNKGAGVILGFAGVAVLMGPSAIAGLSGSVIAEGAILAAALSYAFAGIFGRRFADVAPLTIATGQVTASTVMLIPIAALADQPWTLEMPSIAAWAALIAIALVSTALAYMLYFRILAVAGATNLLLVTFLIPISALLLGGLVLHETITAHAFYGMILIGLGLAAIDGRPLRWIGGFWKTVTP